VPFDPLQVAAFASLRGPQAQQLPADERDESRAAWRELERLEATP
jgi:hypothetical protein